MHILSMTERHGMPNGRVYSLGYYLINTSLYYLPFDSLRPNRARALYVLANNRMSYIVYRLSVYLSKHPRSQGQYLCRLAIFNDSKGFLVVFYERGGYNAISTFIMPVAETFIENNRDGHFLFYTFPFFIQIEIFYRYHRRFLYRLNMQTFHIIPWLSHYKLAQLYAYSHELQHDNNAHPFLLLLGIF